MVQFHKIALALAFSPRTQALLAEVARLKNLWNAELILIHVGDYGDREKLLLNEFLASVNLSLDKDVRVCWEQGKPSERILPSCTLIFDRVNHQQITWHIGKYILEAMRENTIEQ